MLVVHHLNNSRSQRILWLLEELGTAYEIVHHQRDAVTNLAPPELLAVHSLGKSPVIVDDGLTISESGAIVEYICERHGGRHLVPASGTEAHVRHLELMHFAEGSAMTPILLALYVSRLGEAAAPLLPRIGQQLDSHFDYMESLLRPSGHYVLDDLSAADIMLSFPAEVAAAQGRIANRPKLAQFVEWLQARPAYRRALEKADLISSRIETGAMNLGWWSGYFKAAAAFNLAVALPMLVMPHPVAAMLGDASLNHPPLTQLLAWMILTFGVGYWLVARDLVRNRALAALGAMGKLGVVVIAWTGFVSGSTPLMLALLSVADLFWAIGFLRFHIGSARLEGG